jgi:eukaryotic-like serine/threonine-protein kinase
MDWSSDGRFIFYEQDDPTGEKRTLWILGTRQGDATPRRYNESPFNTYVGRISPDNRWVAFQSNETGRYEIYMDTFPKPRGKVRISTAGGILPRWSAGGHEVLYVGPDFTLMTVRVNSGNPQQVSTPERLFVLPAVHVSLIQPPGI